VSDMILLFKTQNTCIALELNKNDKHFSVIGDVPVQIESENSTSTIIERFTILNIVTLLEHAIISFFWQKWEELMFL